MLAHSTQGVMKLIKLNNMKIPLLNDILIKYLGKIERYIQRTKKRIIDSFLCLISSRHRYIIFNEYVKKHPDDASYIYSRAEENVYSNRQYIDSLTPNVILKDQIRATEIRRISFAKCFVFSDLIELPNGEIIYRLKEDNIALSVADFSDEILLIDKKKWCKLRPVKDIIHIEKAVKIGGMFGFNYYHFMIQLLPKMEFLRYIPHDIPIILDYSARDVDSMREAISVANKDQRTIIYMEYGYGYKIDELYDITLSNFIIPNVKKGISYIDIWASFSISSISYLRNLLLNYKDTKLTPQKIFIARRQASSRRKYNEVECGEMLKSYGFVEVYPETMTLYEQIALFNNAKFIISASGAALTNLLFCKPNTQVVILTNYKSNAQFFSSFGSILNLNILFLYDKSIELKRKQNTNDIHSAYNIDTNELKRIII